MASPFVESHTGSPTLSDHGYHPGLSGPDLAVGRAITAVQAQWAGQFNQLQTCQRLLEARLQQMSESQTQMMSQVSDMMSHMLLMSQSTQQPRRQGRPHPGKSMRAKKRKQAQALLEQANSSSSEGASDVDRHAAAQAPAAAAAAYTTPQSQTAAVAAAEQGGSGSTAPNLAAPEGAPASTCEAAIPLERQVEPPPAAAAAEISSATARASAAVAHVEQTEEGGWVDVGKHRMESSASLHQQQLGAAEGDKALIKAAVEEACCKLVSELGDVCQAANESLAATLSEQMQRDMSEAMQEMKQQHAEEMRSNKYGFSVSVAALKEEMLEQLRFAELVNKQQLEDSCSMKQALDAMTDVQQKEAEKSRTLLAESLTSVCGELQRELQEVQQKCNNLQFVSAEKFKRIVDDFAGMKAEIGELKDKITQLTKAVQDTRGQQQLQPAEISGDVIVKGDDDQAGAQELPPSPGLKAVSAGQTPTPGQQTTSQTKEADTAPIIVTAAGSTSPLTPAPSIPLYCRVIACYWQITCCVESGETRFKWKLEDEKELPEPFCVTETTLSALGMEAAKALWPNDWKEQNTWHMNLMDISGDQMLPQQDRGRSLQRLGCGEGSLLKLHFGHGYCARCGDWWSYEIIAATARAM